MITTRIIWTEQNDWGSHCYETQEEKDYYWDLLDKADFAEDYE